MVIAVVVIIMAAFCKADCCGNQPDAARNAQRGECRLPQICGKGLLGNDFGSKDVFRHGGNRVVEEATVHLRANQCALSLGEVVFDNEVGAVIEGNQQVVAFTIGDDAFRADAGGLFGELVVHTIHCLNVLGTGSGVDVVLPNDVAGVVFQSQGDLLCHD